MSQNICQQNLFDEIIAPTNFAGGWLCKVVYENDPRFKESLVDGQKVGKITTIDLHDGHGFASKVFKIAYFFENSPDPFYHVICKVPNKEGYEKLMEKMYGADYDKKESDATQAYKNKLLGIHNNECNFFEHFNSVPGFPIPRLISYEKWDAENGKNGYVFMEFLDNTKAPGFVPTLNLFQILHQKQAWKGLFGKSQTDTNMHEEKCKAINGVKGYKDGLFSKLIEDLENVFYNYEANKYFVLDVCDDLGLPQVVCHGDFHSNNIMFKLDKDGSMTNEIAAFVDFQAIFEGNPALDLARLLITSVDAEVRREAETFIFDLYLEKLTLKLGEHPDFDAETFKTAYEFAVIYQTTAVIMLPPYFKALGTGKKYEGRQDILEAEVAKFELRARLALEDAKKIVDKHQEKLKSIIV